MSVCNLWSPIECSVFICAPKMLLDKTPPFDRLSPKIDNLTFFQYENSVGKYLKQENFSRFYEQTRFMEPHWVQWIRMCPSNNTRIKSRTPHGRAEYFDESMICCCNDSSVKLNRFALTNQTFPTWYSFIPIPFRFCIETQNVEIAKFHNVFQRCVFYFIQMLLCYHHTRKLEVCLEKIGKSAKKIKVEENSGFDHKWVVL